MSRVSLLLSFDHELGLGGARDYDANLFRPTERVLGLADELDVPVTLFTDVLCAMRFREWDREGFYEPYRRQIAAALSAGHDVQLHIHPHWADSDFDGQAFRPSRSFALADFAERPGQDRLEALVARCADFLRELCSATDPRHRVVAYRAGGFNMAPQTPRILRALWDAGIRIDSSIPKGFVFRSSLSDVDYRGMPRAANWRIGLGGPLDRGVEHGDGLLEIPVGTRPRTPWNNLPFLLRRVLLRGRAAPCTGFPIHEPHTPLRVRLGRMFPRSAWLLGFDLFTDTVESQMRILRHHLDVHGRDDEVLVSAISHPKNMGDTSLRLMRGFVEAVRREYGDDAEFVTYRTVQERREAPAHKEVPCPTS